MPDIVYDRPAVIEAVCEFRFNADGPWDSTLPGLIYQQLVDTFPQKGAAQRFQVQAQAGTPQNTRINIENFVRLHHRDHGDRVFVQLSTHRLSVHVLTPYIGWSAFQPLIEQALTAYLRVATPSGFARLGLRYINRLEPPREGADLSEYLNFYPHMSRDLPQQIGPFNMMVTTPIDARLGTDLLRLVLRSDDKSPRPAMILDLDYLREHGEPAVRTTDGLNWVNDAHRYVLATFENCLTDDTKRRLGRRDEARHE